MSIIEVQVPQLSESVAEGTLASWKKKIGEAVARDEILIDIETDKVVLEVPSPGAGVLVEIVKADGETVASGELIARIDTEAKAGAAAPAAAAPKAAAAPLPPPLLLLPGGTASPSARKILDEKGCRRRRRRFRPRWSRDQGRCRCRPAQVRLGRSPRPVAAKAALPTPAVTGFPR
jgi:2-oxoglutarate dehydrogenase E2 component (dihydrolipoamide succinyltransferase)